MTLIKKSELTEEENAITDFIYRLHQKEWLEYCNKYRNGKQSLEHITMLIKSLTSDPPWRYLLGKEQMNALSTILKSNLNDIAKIEIKVNEIYKKIDSAEKRDELK